MTPGEDTASFRASHQPWNETDMYGLKLVLDDWSKKGFIGELNNNGASAGYVSITTRDWTSDDGRYAMMELHKLKGKKVLLWQTTQWAVRFFSCQSLHGAFPEMHGCIGAPTLILALQRAVDEIGHGVAGGSRLEQYYT